MNLKYLLITLSSIVLMTSCTDDLSQIGNSIQPKTDIVSLNTDTFDLSNCVSTVAFDSINSRSSTSLLGSIEDPLYGKTTCDYLTQYACTDTFNLPKMATNKLDSVVISLYYTNVLGNTGTPMQISIYKLTKPLQSENYSNLSVSKYCDKSILLGKRTIIPNSSKNGTINIKITDSNLLNDFYNELQKGAAGKFASNTLFQQFFYGTYITTNFGTSSAVDIRENRLFFFYQEKGVTINNKDTTYSSARAIASNDEVYQCKRYVNEYQENLTNPTTGVNYIKSPAGVYTLIKFPIRDFINKLNGQNARLIGAKFTINTIREENNIFSQPTSLMLIRKKDLSTFFDKKFLFNNNLAYQYCIASNTNIGFKSTYSFDNLTTFFDKELKSGTTNITEDLAIIPIDVSINSDYGIPENITNLHGLNALKINTTKGNFQLTIVKAKN